MTTATLVTELTRIDVTLYQKRDTLDSLNRQWSFHKRILDTAGSWNELICAAWNLNQTERRIAVIERELVRLEALYYAYLSLWAIEEVEAIIVI